MQISGLIKKYGYSEKEKEMRVHLDGKLLAASVQNTLKNPFLSSTLLGMQTQIIKEQDQNQLKLEIINDQQDQIRDLNRMVELLKSKRLSSDHTSRIVQ